MAISYRSLRANGAFVLDWARPGWHTVPINDPVRPRNRIVGYCTDDEADCHMHVASGADTATSDRMGVLARLLFGEARIEAAPRQRARDKLLKNPAVVAAQ